MVIIRYDLLYLFNLGLSKKMWDQHKRKPYRLMVGRRKSFQPNSEYKICQDNLGTMFSKKISLGISNLS